jgi:hypothetical protein
MIVQLRVLIVKKNKQSEEDWFCCDEKVFPKEDGGVEKHRF